MICIRVMKLNAQEETSDPFHMSSKVAALAAYIFNSIGSTSPALAHSWSISNTKQDWPGNQRKAKLKRAT